MDLTSRLDGSQFPDSSLGHLGMTKTGETVCQVCGVASQDEKDLRRID